MDRLLLPRSLGRLPVFDAALAALLCVFAVGGLVTGQVAEGPLAVTVPVAALSTAAVAVRTRYPLAATALVSTLAVAQAVLVGQASNTLWALVVFLVVAYTVAAECDEGRALVGLGIVVGSQFLCEWLDHGSDYPFDALVFGGVWLFGRATRSWRNQATHAEQHRHDLARIAVVEERTRIARDLHDVVAHSLSVIAVQADAAEAALRKDPARAGPPLRAIRDSAREALDDMRQLLRVLRAEDAAGPVDDLTPARGIADLPNLVATMRDSGLPLEADLGPVGSLSSGTELTVYRIAQEGLTNVRKHAGDPPTRLRVSRSEGRLEVEVHNQAPDPARRARPDLSAGLSTGLGLIGLRERVSAAGGTLDEGATPGGGFRLLASIPIGSGRDR